MTDTPEHPPRYTMVDDGTGWSYVVGQPGDPTPEWTGPWRYRWEAQEEADRLNKAEVQ